MLTFVMLKVDEATLISVSIASISDIVESMMFVVDKNRLNKEFC